VMIQIGVIDDHKLFLKAFVLLLRQISDQLDFKIDAHEITIEGLTKSLDFLNLIFLDLEMEEKNGIELLTELKLSNPDLRIIILSMHTNEKVVRDAMKKGADGYLSKRTDIAELVEAIRTVLTGKVYLGDDINKIITDSADDKLKGKGPINRFNTKMHITKREAEILDLISKGMSNRDMAAQLYISNETVSVHRKNLMKKLGVSSVTGLLKVASELDLI